MSDAPFGIVTDYLRRVAPVAGGDSDAGLLGRYVRDREAEAFASLVQRHGPMVLGVCRRALGPSPDADDAFQATFLALARNAGRVRSCLPGWLYRVAVRASRKALARRPGEPAPEVADPGDPFAAVEWRDVRRVLDEEIDQLPVRWRTPLVLCYLNGLTRDEAAGQLGWSLRTLHRRLDEGRRALQARLRRRGLGPALLAAAVLTPAALQARVPTDLLRQAAALGIEGMVVRESVRALVPRVNTSGGWAMKTAVATLIAVGGTIVVLGSRQPAGADPVPKTPAAPAVARAPAKADRPPEDELGKKVREAQDKGIEYLKNQQKDQGGGIWNWENDQLATVQAGGSSALALLALLESGVKADDAVVARGLKFLRTLPPKHTYVVGLQTQVFCKANQKGDAPLIKRNVKWLEGAATRNAQGEMLGWSYTAAGGDRADNSNNRYALAGLYAAHKAGFGPANADFWKQVRELYVRTQTADGGWTYANAPGSRPTHTMTGSGIVCLLQAKDAAGKGDKETDTAITKGLAWIDQHLVFQSPPHTFYNFDVIAAVGRTSERKQFGAGAAKREWYREGAEWLLKNQKAGGEWQINQPIDHFPVISTSFALRFLASRPD
jgi:RNA polymerase sigma factor (sigma-70 family)